MPKNLTLLDRHRFHPSLVRANDIRGVGGDTWGEADAYAVGRIVRPDQYLAPGARPVLKQRPGATVIADIKASEVLFDCVRRAGGNPLMWKTGHASRNKTSARRSDRHRRRACQRRERLVAASRVQYPACLVARREADDEASLSRIKDELAGVVGRVGLDNAPLFESAA